MKPRISIGPGTKPAAYKGSSYLFRGKMDGVQSGVAKLPHQ
jgi:hypothetical protein